MKNLKLIFVILLLISLESCENEENQIQQGRLSFSFKALTPGLGGGRTTQITAKYLLISVVDNSGVSIYQKKKIELFLFGDEYLSEPIEFKPGTYGLSEFLVLDSDGMVIYATPLEGSKLAYLVEDPLPIEFQIMKDQTAKVIPQVIEINEITKAEDLGYSTFSFDVVKTLKFQIAVFAYSSTTHNFELTTSHLSLVNGAETLFNQELPDSTTQVVIKFSSDSTYNLTVSKSGFIAYHHTFTAEELSKYDSVSVLRVMLFNQSLSEGLVAYYPFNGNTQDSSGNGLHGTAYGATLAADRHGIANAAYSFDGNDYIKVQHNELINFGNTDDFSISVWAWVDPNQTPDGTINDIIRKWNGDTQGYPFAICYDNDFAPPGTTRTFLAGRYNNSICYESRYGLSGVVSMYNFHHIVFTKQAQTLNLYVNNNLVNSFSDVTGCSTKNTSDMTIGCRGQLARFFIGKIDDIRIYNRALSTDDINMLYRE